MVHFGLEMLLQVPLQNACRLLYGGPVAYLSSGLSEIYNVMAVSWLSPLSQDPPLIGAAISRGCWSHHLILQSGEFTLSIPHSGHLAQIHAVGTTNGRDVAKISKFNLMTRRGEKVRAPYIVGCIAYMECELRNHQRLGDHTLFTVEVVNARADDEYFDEYWTEEAETLHHLGGDRYRCGNRVIHAADVKRNWMDTGRLSDSDDGYQIKYLE